MREPALQAGRDEEAGGGEQGREAAGHPQPDTCESRFDQCAANCAEGHAEPGHALDQPSRMALADQHPAKSPSEPRQAACNIGEPDGQAFDMLDGGVDHAHCKNDQVELRYAQARLGQKRGDDQQSRDRSKDAECSPCCAMGDDDAKRIADDEGHQAAEQQEGVV